MKHFIREKASEYTDIHERKFVIVRPSMTAAAKKSYRQRERRALNRATRLLVESY